MFNTVQQFSALARHNLEGMEGVSNSNPNPNPNHNPDPNPISNPNPNPNPTQAWRA
jgi:hypothetical protein